MNEQEQAWLTLGRAMLPCRKVLALLERLGSPQALLAASANELELLPSQLERLQQARQQVGKDQAACRQAGACLLSCQDDAYPSLLRQIHDPPVLLYVRGGLLSQDRRAVAVVGSRRTTPYGRMVAQSLGRGLAEAGVTVVSGLAVGIDAAAHRGALEGGGRTIAVLGCGIDRCYPAEHTQFAAQVAAAGAVMTEFPPGTPPLAHHFPIRNRIITGLTLGTVVVEAPLKSGALLSAGLALEQGREVFAVPGSVNSELARGNHLLLKEGAKLVESVEDILEELDLEQCHPRAPLPAFAPGQDGEGEGEDPLLQHLSLEPVGIEELQGKTSLAAGELSARLLLLELKGLVGRLPGNRLIKLQ